MLVRQEAMMAAGEVRPVDKVATSIAGGVALAVAWLWWNHNPDGLGGFIAFGLILWASVVVGVSTIGLAWQSLNTFVDWWNEGRE